MKYEINEDFLRSVRYQLRAHPRTAVRKGIQEALGCGKTKANEIIAAVQIKEKVDQQAVDKKYALKKSFNDLEKYGPSGSFLAAGHNVELREVLGQEKNVPETEQFYKDVEKEQKRIEKDQDDAAENYIENGKCCEDPDKCGAICEYLDEENEADEALEKVSKFKKIQDTLEKGMKAITEKEEQQWGTDIEFKERYVYNGNTDQYVFTSKKAKTGFITLAGSTVRDIQRDYSNFDGKPNTILEISRKFQIPRQALTEILSKLGITHDALPVTDEDLKTKDPNELLTSVLEQKRFNFHQELEKAKWKQVQEDALKWQQYQSGVLDPFARFIDNWKPTEYVPVPFTGTKSKSDRVFVAGAFDWHIGARAEGRYLSRGSDWNLDEAYISVMRYTQSIVQRVENDKEGFSKCVVLLGGDLYNSLTGFTERGTPLNNDYGRDTQFDAVMDCLVFFLSTLLKTFGAVEVHYVRGNHGGTTDYALGRALQAYFRTEDRLGFNLYSTRHAIFKINEVLVIMEHGASDQTKHLVPKDGAGRESYVQTLLLDNPELLIGTKQKIFVQGDLHHYVQKDHGSFEYFMLGAMPCGDQYSNAKNLSARPRQNCLIIDSTGVSEVAHIYLD